MTGRMRERVLWRMLFLAVVAVAAAGEMHAQQFPERKHIRRGNRTYETQDWQAAENDYRKAAIESPASVEAQFNLADALYRQGRYEEADNALKALTERESDMNKEQAARAYYNRGNAQFARQMLQEALESYKQSLRLNPDDVEAKYNYAYTKKLLDQNKNDNQNQNDNQDQNNRNNQNSENPQGGNNDRNDNQNNPDGDNNDQNNDQNNRNGDQPEGENNDENSDDGSDGNNGNEDAPTPPNKQDNSSRESGMSQQEAEQILNAIQGQEDKTREKMDAQKAVTVGRSGKNW